MFDHKKRWKDIDIFHSEVSKILADFVSLKSWTGVHEVQPCFEIIDYFIFEMLYLSFKFNCLCNLRDIRGFLKLHIHENAIEIAFKLKEDFMQRRELRDRHWIIKITCLTGRTNKFQILFYTKSPIFHIFESVFNPTTSSFPSNRQHLAESDKIFVNFDLTH